MTDYIILPCEIYKYPDPTSNLASKLFVQPYDTLEKAREAIECTNVNAGDQLCAGPAEIYYCAVDNNKKVIEGSVARSEYEVQKWLNKQEKQ